MPASVRFLSIEPLLGPIPNLPLDGISWVIVGGESGPNFREVSAEWVREIRDQCVHSNVPFSLSSGEGLRPKQEAEVLIPGCGTKCQEMKLVLTISNSRRNKLRCYSACHYIQSNRCIVATLPLIFGRQIILYHLSSHISSQSTKSCELIS